MDDTTQLNTLIMVSWILLIPVGVLLIIALFKLVFILHGLGEFQSLARYELYPTLKDLRQVAHRAEILSEKAVTGVTALEKGMEKGAEIASHGVGKLKGASAGFAGGAGSLMGTLLRATWDAAWKKR